MPIFDESRLAHRLRVGLVFDGGQLLNHLTVRENIALPLRYHQNLDDAAAAPKVQEFLRAFELEPFANSTPGAIGRSWQKRVGLARGLILNPDLLLVDNPLGALDLKHACWWLQFLDQLSRGQALNGGKPVTLVLAVSELRPWRARARQFGFLQEQRFFTADSWSEASTIHAERVRDLLEDQQDYLTPGPQT
jgi:ABC-type transporter Mla maintaining outer membrane lipid asymmetry ATPase subunit MlaF